MSPSLAGKVAIVTERVVAIADLSKASAQSAAKELCCSAFCIDITQQGDWERLRKHTVETFGTLNIIVHNAGTTYKNKPTEQVTPADFDSVFDVNFRSIFLSTTTLVPWFWEKGRSASFINAATD
ncbi:uncharacterized protein SETTUDRAFT_19683 [Exserohilum turcica Et28A]|uniref:Uncharacterized protein n=1 Tax=Exserohilum turcicum (strain 28A) TaxID=671987 RepID=R0IR69_EXST2|nr:uncharacterized protein SETTUDRAFT_19683 [Exserohilum turcica Et28A]EOA87151.1 hypothetical protein SETTUDRAFT_19683 [Exserohilum turcica Et28A]